MGLLNANVKKFMEIEQNQQCHHLMVKQKYPDNKFTWKDMRSCVISFLNLHRCGLSNLREINEKKIE